MFNFFKTKQLDENLYAPVNGTCIPLDDVADKMFADRLMGDGVAFTFTEDTVYAPCDGTVMMIANTKHAFGIEMANGAEILVHIGLDTVNLNGEGLQALVKAYDKVKKGDPIIKLDRAIMEEKNIDLTTPMIVTNGNDFKLTMMHVNDTVIKGETPVILCEK